MRASTTSFFVFFRTSLADTAATEHRAVAHCEPARISTERAAEPGEAKPRSSARGSGGRRAKRDSAIALGAVWHRRRQRRERGSFEPSWPGRHFLARPENAG